MDVIIATSDAEIGVVAADEVARACREAEGDPVLGVATGSSPLPVYAELARRVDAGTLDLRRAHAFALDEYVGLPADHPQRYAEVIRRTVTEPLGLAPARVHVPDGTAGDLQAAAADFEERIRRAGGVDVQILGIGGNGHIGFNEPGSSPTSRTRVQTLAARTRRDNQRFFAAPEEVPTHCLTQGVGTIMAARSIVLVAQGAQKAHAVAEAVEGPVTARCPASVLQQHPRVTVVLDQGAAGLLRETDGYRRAGDVLRSARA